MPTKSADRISLATIVGHHGGGCCPQFLPQDGCSGREDEGHWRGLTDFSPSVAAPNEGKTIRFYLDNPARAAFLMASDAYAGFHGDQLKPFWQLAGAGPLKRVVDNVVLYRISRSYGGGKDREHRFVTSSEELVRLRKQGWVYDGSKGFVHRTP